MLCQVCNELEHKYKCPKCLLKYCSLPCFKTHKDETCDSKTVLGDVGDAKHRDKGPFQESDNAEDESDKVPQELLKKLGSSKQLRHLLKNPHLQKLILDLNGAADPAKVLDSLIKEPIFTEFADKCLNVVQQED